MLEARHGSGNDRTALPTFSTTRPGVRDGPALIRAEWKLTDTGRQAKLYSLTRAGKKQLEKELANWARLSTAINLVVDPA